jgi:hypothetical protein
MSVTREYWRDLCRQAAIEKDPHKLAQLNQEINSIILNAGRSTAPDAPAESKSKSATAS